MPSSSKPSSGKTATQKLTYQPFLLVIAVIALLVKVVLSLSTGTPLIDWLFIVVLILCISAFIVYVWDKSQERKSKQDVSISVGTVKRGEISGVITDHEAPDEENVTIKTKDLEDTNIIGVERKK